MSKEKIIECLKELIESAQARKTEQGIVTYKAFIDSLQKSSNEAELKEIIKHLTQNLSGISAWGFYTKEENQSVHKIFSLKSQM
jgi:prephenate dehydratase